MWVCAVGGPVLRVKRGRTGEPDHTPHHSTTPRRLASSSSPQSWSLAPACLLLLRRARASPLAAAMAAPLLLMLLLAMFTGSDALFCVCKNDASPAAMQKAIDYACGKGADCTQIMPTGPCNNPSTIVAHCSYACNSYYQKNAGMGATCDFMGVATLTGADPSVGACKYPASASGVGTGTGIGTGTGAGTGMGTGATPGAGMGTGAGTGVGTGAGGMGGTGGTVLAPPGSTTTGMPGSPFGGAYGPSGNSMSPDYSHAVGRHVATAGALMAPLLLHFI